MVWTLARIPCNCGMGSGWSEPFGNQSEVLALSIGHSQSEEFESMKRVWLLSFFFLSEVIWAQIGTQSKPSHEVKQEHNVMVPMRDGVHLSTDIYRPDRDGSFPVILVRDPYTNGSGAVSQGRFWASRGYVFLHQDVRGRHDSEGGWYPFTNEGPDGHDSLEWAGTQPWSNGRVAMSGGSYLGFVQWQAAAFGSPFLKALVPMFSPLNIYGDTYKGGAFEVTRIAWFSLMAGRTNQTARYNWEKILWHLPLATMNQAAGHEFLPFWQNMIRHPSYDPYWKVLDLEEELDQIGAPALNIGGWFDIFLQSTFSAYSGLTARGRTTQARQGQKLIVGPWPHGGFRRRKAGALDFGPDSVIEPDQLVLRWLDHWLVGLNNGVMNEPPIRIFVMGENKWRSEQEWPLARAKETKYYLHSQGQANTLNGDGDLSPSTPGQQPPDRFTYDPTDPVPNKGGNLPGASAGLRSGPFDHQQIEARNDVLVYTSDELKTGLEVTGPLVVTLYAASTARDTDFTAKLLDVYPDGRAYNLADGIVRARYRESLSDPSLIEPRKVYPYKINLVATSNLFKKGHRIRVEISSSNFPRFNRNPNTGLPFGMDAELMSATQTIYHDSRYPSHIILPVIPR